MVSIALRDIWLSEQIFLRILDSLFSKLWGKNLGSCNKTSISMFIFKNSNFTYVFCVCIESIMSIEGFESKTCLKSLKILDILTSL